MKIDFEKYGIGLSRSKVVLKDHDPAWVECFQLVSDLFKESLIGSKMETHHVGSTSLPICAKPILDILGGVTDINEFDSFQNIIESIGFVWKGEYGIKGRRYCVLYDESQLSTYVHLHIFSTEQEEFKAHLLFRNYLLAFPNKAQEYGLLKQSILEKSHQVRSKYTQMKADFIQKTLKEAKIWSISS